MKPAALRRLALPLRSHIVRFAVGLLIGASILLMALDHVGNPVIATVRVRLADALAPLLDALGRPVFAARGMIEEAERFVDVWHDNARLRDENVSLLQWRDT
ncbi:MAG: rod shape-determining protein MreC, partial [Alphaproteobacteria bacterium]